MIKLELEREGHEASSAAHASEDIGEQQSKGEEVVKCSFMASTLKHE